MSVKTETRQGPAFIVSEANGSRSRETVAIKNGQSGVLSAGTCVGVLSNASGYTTYDDSDPAVAYGLLLEDVDATGSANVNAAVLVRDAEINYSELPATINANGLADLAATGIVLR